MTKAELEHIQQVCREWLRQPGTSQASRLTVPSSEALRDPIELEIKAILTFDNVLITSAVDAKTGVCYTKLIASPGEEGVFFDTPFAQIDLATAVPDDVKPEPVVRATQKRYQDALSRLAESQPDQADNAKAFTDLTPSWIAWENLDANDEQPTFFLHSDQKLLGYSLLERARSNNQRSGRFHASEDYFEYSEILVAFVETENDCLEANVREAYGLFDQENAELRTRFDGLSTRVNALQLYVADETGRRLDTSEVRIEDLSKKYDDPTERWLFVSLNS
jgi:hypothetical protein